MSADPQIERSTLGERDLSGDRKFSRAACQLCALQCDRRIGDARHNGCGVAERERAGVRGRPDLEAGNSKIGLHQFRFQRGAVDAELTLGEAREPEGTSRSGRGDPLLEVGKVEPGKRDGSAAGVGPFEAPLAVAVNRGIGEARIEVRAQYPAFGMSGEVRIAQRLVVHLQASAGEVGLELYQTPVRRSRASGREIDGSAGGDFECALQARPRPLQCADLVERHSVTLYLEADVTVIEAVRRVIERACEPHMAASRDQLAGFQAQTSARIGQPCPDSVEWFAIEGTFHNFHVARKLRGADTSRDLSGCGYDACERRTLSAGQLQQVCHREVPHSRVARDRASSRRFPLVESKGQFQLGTGSATRQSCVLEPGQLRRGVRVGVETVERPPGVHKTRERQMAYNVRVR